MENEFFTNSATSENKPEETMPKKTQKVQMIIFLFLPRV